MVHEFPHLGGAMIITGTDKSFQSTIIKRIQSNVILHERDGGSIIRLRVWKCRQVSVVETDLFKYLQEDYPSIYAVRQLDYDGSNFNASTAEYVFIPDALEALHFKLKYL